ncbi:MAG: hypothetical protein HFJ47_03675 [Clostridia bacterium]|nr:hypothetical protein [Clostridia bacterium]
MTGLANVVYRGEDTDTLKKGTPYTLIGSQVKADKTYYVLKGVSGEFDSGLFQVPKGKRPMNIGVLKCSNPPAKGMILENLEVSNDGGKLEPVQEEEEVTAVHVIWGDVYDVHTKKGNAYIVRHCPDAVDDHDDDSEKVAEKPTDTVAEEKTTE